MADLYAALFYATAVLLAFMLFACLFRAVKGPSTPDRIIAVNMTGSLAIAIISIMAALLGENYLADVALIYTTISFVAVVALCKIYIGIYRARHAGKEEKDNA